MEISSEPNTNLGRRRDPDLDGRAIQAALEIYGALGYAGFTFGKVAERARVGKSSLYLRWPTKDDLLGDAFQHIDEEFSRLEAERAALPFVDRVIAVVTHRLSVYFGPMGVASLRVLVDHVAQPNELAALWERSAAKSLARAVACYEAAIDDGDLVAETPAKHLARAIEGSAMVHALGVQRSERDAARERIAEDAKELAMSALRPWLTPKAYESAAAS